MKRSLLACALGLVTVACQGSGQHINDHWNADSIAPRAGRFVLGYDAQKDGGYRDFNWERKQHINLTLRRHVFHHNPDNPNHPDVAQRRRPLNSILPDPVTFFHVESLLIGFGLYGAGGSFIPVPIDSLIGVFEPGGRDEFMEGVSQFSGSTIGAVTSTFAHKYVKGTISAPVKIFHRVVD